MSQLIRTPNLDRVDDVYQQLLQMHEGLDESQSLKASARLILTLANHIGSSAVVLEAIALATLASASASAQSTTAVT